MLVPTLLRTPKYQLAVRDRTIELQQRILTEHGLVVSDTGLADAGEKHQVHNAILVRSYVFTADQGFDLLRASRAVNFWQESGRFREIPICVRICEKKCICLATKKKVLVSSDCTTRGKTFSRVYLHCKEAPERITTPT